MALSKLAQKLLQYFNIYHISPTVYNTRIGGTLDQYYNHNWFADGQLSAKPRIKASPKKGNFKTALAELVDGGY